jgi:hypothetical protein
MAMMLAQKWALSLDARVNARIARWFIWSRLEKVA